MKKTLSILACALVMTGCTSGPDMTTVTSEPTATLMTNPNITPLTSPEASPAATGVLPGMIDGMEDATGIDMTPGTTMVPESTGVTTTDKAKRAVEQIEEELERLSEVDDAEVIIAGSKAAVALEFDDQYQGGVDDRLRGIVKARIDSVISGISTVAVTADKTIFEALDALGDQLDTVRDMSALEKDLDAVIRKINAGNA